MPWRWAYRSSSGSSWAATGVGPADVAALVVDPLDPLRVCAVGAAGLAGCGSQKEPAEQAMAAIEKTLADSGAQVQKYLPERYEAIDRRVKARVAVCEKDGSRCRVTPFFEGLRWFEIKQLDIPDVRLVPAAELTRAMRRVLHLAVVARLLVVVEDDLLIKLFAVSHCRNTRDG